MCRSDPLWSTRVFSSSGSVAILVLCQLPVSSSRLLHGFSRHFLDRRHALHDLPQTAAAERDHALVHGLPFELERRSPHENQLAELLGDFHDLVEADAPLVAGAIAPVAALAALGNHALRF